MQEPYLTQNADVDNEKKEESAVDDNRRSRDLNIDVDIPEKVNILYYYPYTKLLARNLEFTVVFML